MAPLHLRIEITGEDRLPDKQAPECARLNVARLPMRELCDASGSLDQSVFAAVREIAQRNRCGAHERTVTSAPATEIVHGLRRGPSVVLGRSTIKPRKDCTGLIAYVSRTSRPPDPFCEETPREHVRVTQRFTGSERFKDRDSHRGIVGPLSDVVSEDADAKLWNELIWMRWAELVLRTERVSGRHPNHDTGRAVKLPRREDSSTMSPSPYCAFVRHTHHLLKLRAIVQSPIDIAFD